MTSTMTSTIKSCCQATDSVANRAMFTKVPGEISFQQVLKPQNGSERKIFQKKISV